MVALARADQFAFVSGPSAPGTILTPFDLEQSEQCACSYLPAEETSFVAPCMSSYADLQLVEPVSGITRKAYDHTIKICMSHSIERRLASKSAGDVAIACYTCMQDTTMHNSLVSGLESTESRAACNE